MHRCLVYIDLNMVRAGAVDRLEQRRHSGYREIQQPPERYRIIDLSVLCKICGFDDVGPFQQAHRAWVSAALDARAGDRADYWSEAIAVGGDAFVEQVKNALRSSASHRQIEAVGNMRLLREPASAYTAHFDPEKVDLRLDNTWIWDSNPDESRPQLGSTPESHNPESHNPESHKSRPKWRPEKVTVDATTERLSSHPAEAASRRLISRVNCCRGKAIHAGL